MSGSLGRSSSSRRDPFREGGNYLTDLTVEKPPPDKWIPLPAHPFPNRFRFLPFSAKPLPLNLCNIKKFFTCLIWTCPKIFEFVSFTEKKSLERLFKRYWPEVPAYKLTHLHILFFFLKKVFLFVCCPEDFIWGGKGHLSFPRNSQRKK